MKKYINFYFFCFFILGIFQYCNEINGPLIEEKSFLDEISEIEISMNGVSSTHTVIINEKKYNTDKIKLTFISNNENIIDSTNIFSTIKNDSINLVIEPKIGKYGISQISLIVTDNAITDTTKFLVKVILDGNNLQYPTILTPLSSAELEQLRNECPFEIDNYGLISYSGTLSRGQSDIKTADSAVALAKKTIIQYSKFTNVFNESSLSIKEVSNYNGTPLPITDWTVIFNNQVYNELEVLNTGIMAIVHNKVASLKQHHYKNIFIPEENIIPIERIKKILIGQKIEYNCWGPQETVIQEEYILNEIIQKIHWEEIENQIEFRVVWSVPIGSDSQNVSWYVLVDVLSGEIITIQPTFIC